MRFSLEKRNTQGWCLRLLGMRRAETYDFTGVLSHTTAFWIKDEKIFAVCT